VGRGEMVDDFIMALDPRDKEDLPRSPYTMRYYKRPCQRCVGQWLALQHCPDPQVRLADVPDNAGMQDLGVQFGKRWFACTACGAFVFHTGTPHFSVDHQGTEFRASTGLLGRAGRDLRLAHRVARGLPMADRLRYIADTYWDPEVLFDRYPYQERCNLFYGSRAALIDDVLECLPAGPILEVGCQRAGLTAYLGRRHPDRTVVGFDRWERGLSALAPQDMPPGPVYHEGALATPMAEAVELCAGLANVRLVRGDVRETLAAEPDYRPALVVIDLDLYEPTREALAWAWPRLAPDGWILVDDPGFSGVKAALDGCGVPWHVRCGLGVLYKGGGS